MASTRRKRPVGKFGGGKTGKLALAGGLILLAIIILMLQGGETSAPVSPQAMIENAIGKRLAALAAEKAGGKSFNILVFGEQAGIISGLKEAAAEKGITVKDEVRFLIEGDTESMSERESSEAKQGIVRRAVDGVDGLIILGGCPGELVVAKGKAVFCYGPLTLQSVKLLQLGVVQAMLVESRGTVTKQGSMGDPDKYVESNFQTVDKNNAMPVASSLGIDMMEQVGPSNR
ncbi:MAG: hypothetical protein JXR97_14415 [Planctomycetes bacterium]|nr:hypothetical protein [Planctomycetota bacterium]